MIYRPASKLWAMSISHEGKFVISEEELSCMMKILNMDVLTAEEKHLFDLAIKRMEKIMQGEVRKVIVTVREMYDYDTLIVNDIFYRIYASIFYTSVFFTIITYF